jgi:hypothetical protein
VRVENCRFTGGTQQACGARSLPFPQNGFVIASNRIDLSVSRFHPSIHPALEWLHAPPSIDFPSSRFNNSRMPRPDTVRRIKSYSAENGYVYQYCFYEVNRIHNNGSPAGEFIYAVSADRKTTFPLHIVVRQSALQAWAQTNGRPLTSGEEYAVAKMRLFRAFDRGEVPLTAKTADGLSLLVDESNLEELLHALNI